LESAVQLTLVPLAFLYFPVLPKWTYFI